MLIPIILIVEVLCFIGYRNYVSKRNADNNSSKESYNEKKKILRKIKKILMIIVEIQMII